MYAYTYIHTYIYVCMYVCMYLWKKTSQGDFRLMSFTAIVAGHLTHRVRGLRHRQCLQHIIHPLQVEQAETSVMLQELHTSWPCGKGWPRAMLLFMNMGFCVTTTCASRYISPGWLQSFNHGALCRVRSSGFVAMPASNSRCLWTSGNGCCGRTSRGSCETCDTSNI